VVGGIVMHRDRCVRGMRLNPTLQLLEPDPWIRPSEATWWHRKTGTERCHNRFGADRIADAAIDIIRLSLIAPIKLNIAIPNAL